MPPARLQAALDCINGAEAAADQPTLDDLRAAEDAAREANAELAFVGEALRAMSGETSDAHHAVTLLQLESHAAREPEDPELEPDWL